MEITKIKIELESVVPILFDRISGLQDSNEQEAKKNAIHKLYLNGKNEISIPSANIKASIREAGREIGKKMESKKREQAIRAGVFFNEEMISLGIKEPDGIHMEAVTRKGTGNKVTRVMSYRPYISKWTCSCELTLYGLTSEFIKQAIELAGFKYALCGHRPEYGRFVLKSFKIIKEK